MNAARQGDAQRAAHRWVVSWVPLSIPILASQRPVSLIRSSNTTWVSSGICRSAADTRLARSESFRRESDALQRTHMPLSGRRLMPMCGCGQTAHYRDLRCAHRVDASGRQRGARLDGPPAWSSSRGRRWAPTSDGPSSPDQVTFVSATGDRGAASLEREGGRSHDYVAPGTHTDHRTVAH